MIKQGHHNQIIFLKDEVGRKLTNHKEMEQELAIFYGSLLACQSQWRQIQKVQHPNVLLQPNHNVSLVREVSYVEDKEVLISMLRNKEPGLDGFTTYFFQTYWHFLGEEINCLVEEFHNTFSLFQSLNKNLLTIAPKYNTNTQV